MNEYFDRTIIAQAIIIVAISVGGWMMLVAPKAERLHQLQQVIAEHNAMAGPVDQATVEDIAADVSQLKARLATIEALSELGHDSSLLYEQFAGLAHEHGVTIQGMQPGRTLHGDELVQRRRIDLTLEAEFTDLARFLSAIDQMPGFTRTDAIALTPKLHDGRHLVSGSLTCQVFTFDTKSLVQALEGEVHAQP